MFWRKSKVFFGGCVAAFVVTTASLSKDFLFAGPEYEGKELLLGRTYVVTGASSGIGMATATELATRGARVILAGRNEEEGEKAVEDIRKYTYNRQVVFKPLDLSSLASVRAFAADFLSTETRLDGLVNNAGVKEPPKRKLSADGFELQFGVNYLGHFLLTQLLVDKLQSCSPSRIVNLTDISHRRATLDFDDLNGEQKYSGNDAYNKSKLAVSLFTKELGRRLEGAGVYAFAVHPGIVRTKINRHLSVDQSYVAQIFVKPWFWFLTKTPEQGARTVIYCLLAKDIEGQTGGYFKDCAERASGAGVQDPDVANRLWMISEVWTGLKSIGDVAVDQRRKGQPEVEERVNDKNSTSVDTAVSGESEPPKMLVA